jgi:hypothetical protein
VGVRQGGVSCDVLRGEGGLDIHVVAEELSLLRVLSCGRAVDCIRKYMPRLAPLTVPSEPPSHPVHIEIQADWEALPVVVRAADGVLQSLIWPHMARFPMSFRLFCERSSRRASGPACASACAARSSRAFLTTLA